MYVWYHAEKVTKKKWGQLSAESVSLLGFDFCLLNSFAWTAFIHVTVSG